MSGYSNGLVQAFIGVSLACTVGACQSNSKPSESAAAVPAAKVNPSALQAQAKLPPPASATQRSSIGKGSVMVNTANSSGDTDSFWIAQIDIDGDGTLEQTELLWDDEDKVLFAYSETDTPCRYGGTAVAAVLAGVNGTNSPRGRAAGSGFYAVEFDALECGADRAGLFGCTFDAMDNVSSWAAVVVDSEGDEVDVIGTN
jgi:hypothetical protein